MPGDDKQPKKSKRRKGRRARGTGSVFFHEGRQRWVARKVVGGVKVERWGETQREAIEKLVAALPPDPNTVTVTGWAERWRATLTGRPSTLNNARISLDLHILPAMGAVRLADVTTAHVEQLIARLLSAEGGVGTGTARKIVQHARQLFGAAVRAELIDRNPAAHAKKPRHTPAAVETYTPGQLAAIIAAAPRWVCGGVIATLAGTGARIGEVLGLDVGDWDRAKGTLRIDKTYSFRFGVGPPKSRHSVRTISVPDVLFPILDAAAGGRTEGPLFATTEGNRRPAQTVLRPWRAVLRTVKLPYKKPHALRHSVATALIAAQVPIPDVARFLGDTVATLVRCYVHPTWADPAHTLNRLYGVHKVGTPHPSPDKPCSGQGIRQGEGCTA